jgi:hypothetical protein
MRDLIQDFLRNAVLEEGGSPWVFLLITVALGGAASTLAGRAVAATWRPWWHVIAFTLLIGAVVRFLHFALFGGTLLSLQYYVADTAICLAFALVGFRLMRVSQMVTSYGWINERAGLFAWRRRRHSTHNPESG